MGSVGTPDSGSPRGVELQASGNDELVIKAKNVIDFYLKPGVGSERSVQAYNETSVEYDKYVGAFDYTAPQKVAQVMAELYPEQSQREAVRILDVAAGTGLVGVELHKLGFRHMDALDPSQGMLDVAAKRNVYEQLFTEYINDKQLPIDENTYDCICIAGGMGENQIPSAAFIEMIRLVRPGGYIVNATRVEHLTNCTEYIGRLENLIERLETEGRWKKITRTTFPNFLRGKEGLLLIYQVV